MKYVIAVALALLAFSSTAAAGNPSLCAKDGWLTAQSDSGASFSSMKECAKAKTVFKPSVSIIPTHVGANESFTLTASGFHPSASTIVYFAITGQDPYWSFVPSSRTSADGSISIPFVFQQCGNSPDDLTITLVDSFGVHASARMTLC